MFLAPGADLEARAVVAQDPLVRGAAEAVRHGEEAAAISARADLDPVGDLCPVRADVANDVAGDERPQTVIEEGLVDRGGDGDAPIAPRLAVVLGIDGREPEVRAVDDHR